MAHMNQEKKAKLAPKINAVLKTYNVKGTISVRLGLALVVKIKSGAVDFKRDCNVERFLGSCYPGQTDTDIRENYFKHDVQVNPYWIEQQWNGQAKDFLLELLAAMNEGNHDNSDIMTDYFDVNWYTNIIIGAYEKPYVLTNNC